jgi:exosortase/archaeosortase family protein
MNKDSKKTLNIFIRYFAVFLVGLGNLYVFYKVLTYPTVFSVNNILSMVTETAVSGTSIFMRDLAVEIIPACVMGAAFYLLFALVFLTGDIKPIKRTKLLIYAFISLFVLNVLRILFLILINKINSFEIIHWVLWNIVSAIFIVAIWLALTKLFKIKSIPVYTDFKYLMKFVQKRRRN